jgi:hypothetical protein
VNPGGLVLPFLPTDKEIEMVLYVDQTVVEAYFMGGRLALTQHVPINLLRPLANAAEQTVEVFGAGVTLLNATVWKVGDIWDPVTHGRPHRKPQDAASGKSALSFDRRQVIKTDERVVGGSRLGIPSPLPDNCPYGSPEKALPCKTHADCPHWPCVFCTNQTAPWSAATNATYCMFGDVDPPDAICGAPPPPPKNASAKQHLMIGDSISFQMNATVTASLAERGVETVHVPVNAGDTGHIKRCVNIWLGAATNRWDVITINSGIHDLTSWPGPNASHPPPPKPTKYEVPLTDYVANLKVIARAMKANSAKASRVWVTTTPCPECACCCGGPPEKWVPEAFRNQDVISYNAAAKRTLVAEGIAQTVDLYAAIIAHKGCAVPYETCPLQLPNNVHFEPAGVALNAQTLVAGVLKQLTAARNDGWATNNI